MKQVKFEKELVRIRKSKGLTQSELAEICNISYRTIQRIESGIVSPRSYTVKALSTALDFDFLKEFPDYASKKNKFFLRKYVLFNLKTNPMKKLAILSIIIVIISTGVLAITNNSFAQKKFKNIYFSNVDSISSISKKECLKRIKKINREATFHNQAIDIIKTYANKSNYNFDTYVILSELISSFGHSTKPAMEIASIVFLSSNDCDLFNEIAPLIF